MSLARLNDPVPHARLLSNGRYSVLLTGAGSGYSVCNGYALTNWTADRTEDADGFFVYLRDLDDGSLWSVGHQPVQPAAEMYDASYEPGRMRITSHHAGIAASMNVCVVPNADLEIRQISVHNLSDRPRRIELTSYAEVVLNQAAAHAAHPTFSNLFVETEFDPLHGALLATRRPRSSTERHPWMLHTLAGNGSLQYETDRARFIGRSRSAAQPAALIAGVPLSATTGSVLNPIFSLRRTAVLAVGERAHFTLLLGAAETRAAALELVTRYSDSAAVEAAFAAARDHEHTLLRRLTISAAQAEYWQELAGAMLYADPRLRTEVTTLRRAHGSLADLAKYEINSASCLVVVHVEDHEDDALLRDLLGAQAYWQSKGLEVRLLILCADPSTLADDIAAVVRERNALLCRRAELPPDDLDRLHAAAHLVVSGSLPALDEPGQLHVRTVGGSSSKDNSAHPELVEGSARRLSAVSLPAGEREGPEPFSSQSLVFFNGIGGFSADGNEYVIQLAVGTPSPPMPWTNVIANEAFGCLISERGAGYTWSRNSRENRLTPWFNDPITDPHGEALYIRDDETRVFWSPQPGPAADNAAYEVRHGFGYTRWRHTSAELEQDVLLFVPRHDPVRIARLRLTNTSDRPRRLSLFSYHRLVLGVLPAESGRFVVSEVDAGTGALLACNRLNNEFNDGIVYAAAVTPSGAEPVSVSGDRTAFIGRNGSLAAPAAVRTSAELDGVAGAGLDPCSAVQMIVHIAARSTVECAFLLGEATDEASWRGCIARYRQPDAIDNAFAEVRDFWQQTLTAVQIETPSRALDLMLNGWLLYQTLSCRLWGRSAFYQSGGAFGFRDQLQDSAALIYSHPELTRAQIVLHAAHQFVEGDVLHWWHPPTSRGMRTHFSDDLVWLPFITAFYVRTTGDWTVLDEPAGFMTARALEPGEDEAYLLPTPSDEHADIYAHCCRALDRALTRGAHGLPLMGTGDWNDGMNRVGREGRGESVWMGFFLSRTIDDFVPLCEHRGDRQRIERYRAYQTDVQAALNEAGWDGQWYRRAYYDDGAPLGSAECAECRIDALAQAWAVLSGVAPPARAAQAMDAVEQQLVSRDIGVIRLLTPPFDRDPHDPGYIKGYVPGIRENGGQYTHAAVWVVQALAELRRRDRAAAALDMLSPVNHARTPAQVARYQVEPYVVAADIYGVEPHLGRGGWTWYTGSAGWMYRVALESVLGLRIEGGEQLRLTPCVPDEWPEFRIRLRRPDRRTTYEIIVHNPSGCAAAPIACSVDDGRGTIDGAAVVVPLAMDGAAHRVIVTLGKA